MVGQHETESIAYVIIILKSRNQVHCIFIILHKDLDDCCNKQNPPTTRGILFGGLGIGRKVNDYGR